MIAPAPVNASLAPGAEPHPRPQPPAVPAAASPDPATDASASPRQQQLAELLPPLPPPPDPPGTAYVAAVLSGALSPKPVTPQDVYLRTGEWTPPDSPLRLADKTI